VQQPVVVRRLSLRRAAAGVLEAGQLSVQAVVVAPQPAPDLAQRIPHAAAVRLLLLLFMPLGPSPLAAR
jgi:hypothetical protein